MKNNARQTSSGRVDTICRLCLQNVRYDLVFCEECNRAHHSNCFDVIAPKGCKNPSCSLYGSIEKQVGGIYRFETFAFLLALCGMVLTFHTTKGDVLIGIGKSFLVVGGGVTFALWGLRIIRSK